MKKIALQYYSRLNFGDDLFVKVFAQHFRSYRIELIGNPICIPKGLDSNVRISPWSWPITIVSKLLSMGFLPNPVKAWLRSKYNLFIARAKKRGSACVLIGGSLFQDYCPSPETPQIPFDIPESYLRDYSFNSQINESSNEFIIGANLGPAFQKDYFERMHNLLKDYAHVCLRDYASYYPFRLVPHIQYAPDVGFMHLPNTVPQENNTIVLSVMDISHHTNEPNIVESYNAFMANTAIHFSAMGYQVIILSMCSREGDDLAAQHILDLIPDHNNVHIHSYDGNLEEVFSLFSHASLVVATRFHSMIMGFVYGKPVFPIVYNCKMQHYLQDLHFTGHWASLETLKDYTVEDVKKSAVCDCSAHKQYAHIQFEALKRYLDLL